MDEVLRIKSRYSALRIPLVSWIMLVFPLVLPPIPLGPIVFASSWDRFEEVDLVKRARRFADRPGPSHGFLVRWLVNTMSNLIDIATLGLRSAFMAAWLADAVNAKSAKSSGVKSTGSHIGWLLKWLLLGNVIFLAVWVVYPGWVLLRFVNSMEQALYDAYRAEPLNVEVDTENGSHVKISAEPAFLSKPLLESNHRLVLLGVYIQPLASTEMTEGQELLEAVTNQVLASAQQILQNDVAVYWCNLAQSYPTHYQKVGSLLPNDMKTNGKWIAFHDGKIVCVTTSCSETIAKALGTAATIRAIDNMVFGLHADKLDTIEAASQKRPVLAFIGEYYNPLLLVKNASPAFLQAVATRNAVVYFIKLEKKGALGEELRKYDILFTGCAIWDKGQPVERIKMSWYISITEHLAKITAWLSSSDMASTQNPPKKGEYQYRSLPCYIFGQWEQVIEASATHPVVLACGSAMNTRIAESLFLHRVGSIFIDRGFCLAVAPIAPSDLKAAGSVASGLRTAGFKTEGCYIVQRGQVIATIAKASPPVLENGWLDPAMKYLMEYKA